MSGSPTSFADRLQGAQVEKQSCLVVGLDPVIERLPPDVLGAVGLSASGGEGFTARASAAIGLFLVRVIEAVADLAVAVKPNTAFFERHGAAGWECLREICRRASKAGLLVIADAKRGDIGPTAEAYADSLLGSLPDTPGPWVDAVTVNPYLGTDSMEPFLRAVRERGKGIFVLVRTSNPSAGEIQDLPVAAAAHGSSPRPLYLHVADLVARWGQGLQGSSGFSSVGAVVGATAPEEAGRIRAALPHAFFLLPGYGAQGAAAAPLRSSFLPGGRGAVVNASRSILFAYEKRPGAWVDAVRAAAMEAREELNGLRFGTG